MESVGNFSIGPEESLQFARVSGDFNPLHLDPVAARRTQFGATLIHGVCGTLKAIDCYLTTATGGCALANIRVKYSKPARQGQVFRVSIDDDSDKIRLEVSADGVRCQVIEFELDSAPAAVLDTATNYTPRCESAGNCRELRIAECDALAGTAQLHWDEALMQNLFPNATRLLPRSQLAALMGCTQIVGMICPGLHSVFAQLTVNFTLAQSAGRADQLEYQVVKTDPRIEQVQMHISNGVAQGSIEAFFRQPPAQQASFQTISGLVHSGEFGPQNALVVGASRGLGEVITKILAASGASIMMTYASGEQDARRIAAEISKTNPGPEVAPLNVLKPEFTAQLTEFLGSVTHIYYLASPTISRGDNHQWDDALYSRYCDFYVHGLATLVDEINRLSDSNRNLHLFIPSSVFLEEKTKGFKEYIAAKTDAENYVNQLAADNARWHVQVPRLPRLHSDQTSGVRGTSEEKTLEVIVGTLRDLYG